MFRVLVFLVFWAPLAQAQPFPVSATLEGPTNRYPHNVLGQIPGRTTLVVQASTGTVLRHVLPENRVFEDIAPRLWDIDADGTPEIVTVESDQSEGARFTAWAIDTNPQITLRAAGEFIGRRFRWLVPVGVADFTGQGSPQVAYVAMPHLARQLVIVPFDGDRFVPVATHENVSNHRIGDETITSVVRLCNGTPQIILPSGDWRRIVGLQFEGESMQRFDLGRLRHPGDIDHHSTYPT